MARGQTLRSLDSLLYWDLASFWFLTWCYILQVLPQFRESFIMSAEVDGAKSAFDRFRLVTWPMLGPTTVFVVTITTIRSFQVFDTVEALTEGGPCKVYLCDDVRNIRKRYQRKPCRYWCSHHNLILRICLYPNLYAAASC